MKKQKRASVAPTPEFSRAYWRVLARYGITDRAGEEALYKRDPALKSIIPHISEQINDEIRKERAGNKD